MVRSDFTARLGETFDVASIGGGATGLGAAVEAASRGYTVALFEGEDFAKGTSSRSTKLVHGGVRYLAQGNVSLVREALRERGRLRRNAPHLVRDLAFIVPAYDWWSGPFYGIGLKLYDVLAGRLNLGTSKLITRQAVLERIPTIEPEGLSGGVVYYDGQFDDARLAVTLAQTAADLGAVVLNHAPVTGLLRDGERVSGVIVRDAAGGTEFEVHARTVINATGVFADSVRKMDDPDAKAVLEPSQGVHLVLPKEFLPGDTALMVPKTDDGRVLFAVPWHERIIVGTTDTPVPSASLEPRPLEEEIEFLITHAGRYLSKDPKREDVLAVFAGLRPLVRPQKEEGNTAALSRDHSIFVSRSGLLTIVGGKWTTYRKMGEDVIDRAAKIAGLPEHESRTAEMGLHGRPTEGQAQPVLEVERLYGTDWPHIQALAAADPTLGERLHPNLPFTKAEVLWAVRQELALTVEDVLSRRMRALLMDARAALAAAPAVARMMALELGRGSTWEEEQLAAFRPIAEAAVLTSPVPETATLA
ncbi:MAG TPA: glycerol-3-phosphate dehydrogenase/oxidase [Deinococcales bacterium]|nr:glycerol-3-phosphate dehydrogenase/oxidase [Deinococcales bacterium]